MTCIIGIETDEGVWIGGDACIVNGNGVKHELLDSNSKVFRNGDFLFGVTGGARLGDILRYVFIQPERQDDLDDDRYLRREFVYGLSESLRLAGYRETLDGVDSIGGGSHFLFAYRGRLYHCDTHMAITRVEGDVQAIGVGGEYARGFVEGVLDPQNSLLFGQQERPVPDIIDSALGGASSACDGVDGREVIMFQARPVSEKPTCHS